MLDSLHTFHIPVMGTGHSADTPIRVAHLGITSVISLVDDLLLEKIRKYYSELYGLPYVRIPKNEFDGRAKRITAYLDTVLQIVRKKMADIKAQPFFSDNDKHKYFNLLPNESPLKKKYQQLLNMTPGRKRNDLEQELTRRMRPGSIDVNIMVKLDRVHYGIDGKPLGDEFTDAKSGLRGYANSGLNSGIVFSAGINQRLFSYMTRFRDFYRDAAGNIKKQIILKVSDFRSALIQGKFLAKKGLEVSEFRIESGLNCGGHAFPSKGVLLPSLLKEFKEKRDSLLAEFQPLIRTYYKKMGWVYPESALKHRPLVTVQGGIGTYGEACRLRKDFNIDRTGWASPFLLVPETTLVDAATLELLRQAREEHLYLSDASPMEIPFNNLRGTGSEIWTRQRIERGRPGSSCPNRFLVSNTEFTEKPICLASRQYQTSKLKEIQNKPLLDPDKGNLEQKVLGKTCICHHLGNGALIALGIAEEENAPQAICPGPNIAWFDKTYTLQEMVDHIYGRGPSLVPPQRPHMFAKEITMYVDYFAQEVSRFAQIPKEIKSLLEFKNNLEAGLELCLEISKKPPYPDENIASIATVLEQQKARLKSICKDFEQKAN